MEKNLTKSTDGRAERTATVRFTDAADLRMIRAIATSEGKGSGDWIAEAALEKAIALISNGWGIEQKKQAEEFIRAKQAVNS